MNMTKLLQVARWEFIEKVKTKAFIISLFVTPLMILVFALLPSLLAMKPDSEAKTFLVWDESGTFVRDLQEALNAKYTLPDGSPNYILVPAGASPSTPEAVLKEYTPRLLKEEFTGMFMIPSTVMKDRRIEYRGTNVGNEFEVKKVADALEDLIVQRSLLSYGIDPEVYGTVTKDVSYTTIKITDTGEGQESGFLEVFIAAYGSTILLFLLVVITGQLLVRSMFEEKNNRIIEILLSSCSPMELMMGKLLGLSGLGILQAVVWLGIGLGVGYNFGTVPDIFSLVPLLLLYMLLGYVFYAAILIGLGSLATTEQEAQQVTAYSTIFIMLPVSFIMPLMENPHSGLAVTLSYIPFFTPTFMAMRIAVQMPAWWEIAATVAVMLVSIVILMYISSRIFRAAILSYGKRPTLPEIIGFLRGQ